jgi:UTP---glucose-1-phosphate uridylyltransferase
MPSKTLSLEQQFTEISNLVFDVKQLKCLPEKRITLEGHDKVKLYFEKPSFVRTFVSGLNDECSVVIFSLIILDQTHIFHIPENSFDQFERLRLMIQPLIEVELFYSSMGGILGYHALFLELLLNKEEKNKGNNAIQAPQGKDISEDGPAIDQLLRQALENLPQMAQLSPVAGAGERLGLLSKEGRALPVARLNYLGFNLLENMFRDIQAWEYLYFKVKGLTHFIPVGLMTSEIHNNHEIISEIVESNKFFFRDKSKILLFKQPQVPVISSNGEWLLQSSLKLHMRPGGHGAIWKQAADAGLLDAFSGMGVQKLFLRQINNPVAAVDYSALAFMGMGLQGDFQFGFASCLRRVGASEGMNVLCNKDKEFWISNIEYTDFQKRGIKDQEKEKGSSYSCFPSNTNILFVDLHTVSKSLKEKILFAPTINLKSFYECYREGSYKKINGGRVESMMQNLADEVKTSSQDGLCPEKLNSFITFNRREKTISVTKKQYQNKKEFADTPYSCFYDLYQSYHSLLENYCNFSVSEKISLEEFAEHSSPFYLYFHPALGPTFSIIGQKLREGEVSFGSYLQLEIAELELKRFHIDGALKINSGNPLGLSKEKRDSEGAYSSGPACSLIDCVIRNRGVDRSKITERHAWEANAPLKEVLNITLKEGAEFEAKGIEFLGDINIEVPAFTKMVVLQEGSELIFQTNSIKNPTWTWQYHFDVADRLILTKAHG